MFPRFPAALAAFLMLGSSLAHAQQAADSRRDRADAKPVNDVCVDHRTSPQGHVAPKPASLHRTVAHGGKKSAAHGAKKAARDACRLQTSQPQTPQSATPHRNAQATKSPRRASADGQAALKPAGAVRLPKVPRDKRGH